MTDSRQSKTRHSPEAAAPEALFIGDSGATLEPFMEAGNRLLDAWMKVGNELLDFGRTRLDQSFAVSKALAQSGSLNEAIDLQSQYARTVVQDYVAEANKIVDLGTRSLLDSMASLRAIPETVAKHADAAE